MVNNGQSRSPTDIETASSAAMTAVRHTPSKLVMRVRFPSPAPKACPETRRCGLGWQLVPGEAAHGDDHGAVGDGLMVLGEAFVVADGASRAGLAVFLVVTHRDHGDPRPPARRATPVGVRAVGPAAAIVCPWQRSCQPGQSIAKRGPRWTPASPLTASAASSHLHRSVGAAGRGPVHRSIKWHWCHPTIPSGISQIELVEFGS
jgi:hypothetical protein